MVEGEEGKGPRVLGAHGFGLSVPDIATAEKFYTTLGMEVRSRDQELVLGSAGRDQNELVISQGSEKRLHHVAFSIRPDDFQGFAHRLDQLGIACDEHAPDGGFHDGLWFTDPWGTWICLVPSFPAPMREFKARVPANIFGERKRVGTLAFDTLSNEGRPMRFQHVLLFTPELDAAEAYYQDTLGLQVSDRKPGFVSFLYAASGHCWDHHCFAIVNNRGRGLHHCSFEMADFDQLGFCLTRMREAGYTGGFGPGRQFLGSNMFAYVQDPWGSHTEISTDMDQLDQNWKTVNWDEIPKLWGPEWDMGFWTLNREVD